jgi:hypothetical protein
MLDIQKQYVVDENQRPVAVQIAIEDFEQIEEILENYGLVNLMENSDDPERLSKEAALEYYRSIKGNSHVDS